MTTSQVLAPATTLTASYNKQKGILVLGAEGREDGLTNIHFVHQPNLGMTKFDLVAQFTPAIGNFPFSLHDSFDIEPDPDNRDHVLIATAGCPEGKTIPIKQAGRE